MLFVPIVTTELKKGSFKAEGKKLEASSCHQNKGETRTQQHQSLRKRKAQPHGHLAAPLATMAHQSVRHFHLPVHLCYPSSMGSHAGMAWELCLSFLGKGCKVPHLSFVEADPQITQLLGFCLEIQGDSQSSDLFCHRS